MARAASSCPSSPVPMQHWGHLCDLIGDCGEPIRAAGTCRLKSDGASPEKTRRGRVPPGASGSPAAARFELVPRPRSFRKPLYRKRRRTDGSSVFIPFPLYLWRRRRFLEPSTDPATYIFGEVEIPCWWVVAWLVPATSGAVSASKKELKTLFFV